MCIPTAGHGSRAQHGLIYNISCLELPVLLHRLGTGQHRSALSCSCTNEDIGLRVSPLAAPLVQATASKIHQLWVCRGAMWHSVICLHHPRPPGTPRIRDMPQHVHKPFSPLTFVFSPPHNPAKRTSLWWGRRALCKTPEEPLNSPSAAKSFGHELLRTQSRRDNRGRLSAGFPSP